MLNHFPIHSGELDLELLVVIDSHPLQLESGTIQPIAEHLQRAHIVRRLTLLGRHGHLTATRNLTAIRNNRRHHTRLHTALDLILQLAAIQQLRRHLTTRLANQCQSRRRREPLWIHPWIGKEHTRILNIPVVFAARKEAFVIIKVTLLINHYNKNKLADYF